MSNDKQEIVWQGDYDAFGQVTVKAVPQSNTQDIQAKRKGWLPTLMNSANAAESVTSSPLQVSMRIVRVVITITGIATTTLKRDAI